MAQRDLESAENVSHKATETQRIFFSLWLHVSVADRLRVLSSSQCRLRGFLRAPGLGRRLTREIHQHRDRQWREQNRDELRRGEHADCAALVAAEELDDEARDR